MLRFRLEEYIKAEFSLDDNVHDENETTQEMGVATGSLVTAETGVATGSLVTAVAGVVEITWVQTQGISSKGVGRW